MLILSETTDNLQVVLAGAVTTSQLQCVASWRDITTSAYTPGRTVAATNSTTDVNIVPAPAASTQRVVDFLSVYNADTAAATITIKLDANGAEYILHKETIAPAQKITFHEGVGFTSSGVYAPQKSFTIHGDAGANFAMSNATQAARFAGNSSRAIFSVDLAGYSQVRLRANVIVASASANTPKFGIKYNNGWSTTYANYSTLGTAGDVEISVATATYIDTGWLDMVAGAKIDGCYICCYEVGGDAAADPALGATDILFR